MYDSVPSLEDDTPEMDTGDVIQEIQKLKRGLVVVYNQDTVIRTWVHSDLSTTEIKSVLVDCIQDMKDQNAEKRRNKNAQQ